MTTCWQCDAQAVGEDEESGVAPLGWMVERDRRGVVTMTCPACTRRHARAIEGKLDASWW